MQRLFCLILASLCLVSVAAARSIPDTIRIPQWLTIGPFSTAPRENSIDYLVEHGGERDIAPTPGMTHTSFLVAGAQVQWMQRHTDSTGAVVMQYDSIPWDTLAQYYGTAGMMATSYAYAEFTCEADGCALALADGVSSFRLNGTVWPGDAYRQHFVRIPVPVRKGVNKVLVKQTGFTGGSFVFQLLPVPPQPVMLLERDFTLPDAIDSAMLDAPAGITLINASEAPVGPITIRTGDGGLVDWRSTVIPRMIPFSIMKVPVTIHSHATVTRAVAGDTLRVPVNVEFDGGGTAAILRICVRATTDTRRVTFISAMDGSAQYYGVAPPLATSGSAKPGLLLSLHGASVEAQGQSEAYQRKDWAYVVAATNRRPYGFDWQDWGAQDALEVLADARARFTIDTNRIWLAGHSMGGHGTWSVGLHNPDLFAAIAPSAGWTSFPLYTPWTLQRSGIAADPEILAIRDRALRHDNLLTFVDNAVNLPAYILHGGSDDNVPAVHARMFTDAMRRAGNTVEYKEVPGMGHWWDDPKTPGTDCIDDSTLLAFLRARSREAWPAHVHLHTVDLAQSSSAYWVSIRQVEVPFNDASVDATVAGNSVVVTTHNVREFTLALPPSIPHTRPMIIVDNNTVLVDAATDGTATFTNTPRGFVYGRDPERRNHRSPAMFGPMKQACFRPFVLVYGTRGDSATTALLMQKARVQAQLWWRVGNGTVAIMADRDVTDSIAQTRNLLLFGGPSSNQITYRLASRLPLVNDPTGMQAGSTIVHGAHLAQQFIYPNPEHPDKFVLVSAGNDYAGEELAGSFGLFGSGTGLPDYMIYDASVRTAGWGGVRAAGFFDNAWKVK